ncbi:GtrA family protein [Falsibacillus pallidus]|uniref:GtrA family protein n=1 Tax=Falsibacillus pallidus TaxID=493781 RepID=UPI003D976A50
MIMFNQIIRFIIVGCINTLTYYILYLLFQSVLGIYYLASHIMAFLISMVGSFYMNSYFTYKTKPTLKKFLQFPLTYVVNITVTTSAIYILVELFHWNEQISPLLASLLAIPFTFAISRFILTK